MDWSPGWGEVSSFKEAGSRSLPPPTIGEGSFSCLLRSEHELYVHAIIKAAIAPRLRGAAAAWTLKGRLRPVGLEGLRPPDYSKSYRWVIAGD